MIKPPISPHPVSIETAYFPSFFDTIPPRTPYIIKGTDILGADKGYGAFLPKRTGQARLSKKGDFVMSELLGRLFGRITHKKVVIEKKHGFDSSSFFASSLLAFLGFVLSGAVVFSNCAPFGIAFFAVADQKKRNIPLFLAVSAGYLSNLGNINPPKYLIALIILFALKGSLHKTVDQNPSVIYLAAGISMFFSGMLFASVEGFLTYDIMLLCCEILLCCMATFLFSISVRCLFANPRKPSLTTQETISILLMVSICFLSLSSLTIGDFSIGRCLGVLVILLVVQSGNISYAAMCGMVMGLIMGMSQREAMTLCAAYGAAALCGAVLFPLGRFASACVFLLVSGLISLYSEFTPMAVIWLYEIMVASAISLLIPQKISALVHNLTPKPTLPRSDLHEEKIRNFCSSRLVDLSEGLRDVFETVKYISTRLRASTPANTSAIIETAADSVCKKCKLGHYCWGPDFDTTMDELTKIIPTLREKGKIMPADFPTEMAVRCIQPSNLIDGLNCAYNSFLFNKKLSDKYFTGRSMECDQFIGLAGAIEHIAKDLRERISFDTEAEELIRAFFEEAGKSPLGVCVLYYDAGSPRVEIDLSSITDLTYSKDELIEELSALCHIDLGEVIIETKERGVTLILTQKENFSPLYAQCQAKKDTEPATGDCVAAFPIYGGRICLSLCDAMGSGKRAALDSTMAVKVLERVLKSGFDCDMAINSLNAALILNSDEERLSSVDLSIIDLTSGRCQMVKAGASPTFVKAGTKVEKYAAKSLPVGILENARPEYMETTLSKGDLVVMVSDGIIGAQDETFLLEILKNHTGYDMTALANLILTQAKNRFHGACPDDMTVIALVMQ